MKMKDKLFLILLAGVLLLAGCADPVSDLKTGAAPELDGESGVAFTIPVLAPWLARALASVAEADVPSRAFMVSDKVEIIAFDSTSTEVKRTSFARDMEPGDSISGSLALDVGTGYTLEVNIYNYAVSETEPVLRGVSPAFDVVRGQHMPVSVACLPINPVPLAEGTPGTYDMLPFVLDNQGMPLEYGGETWFSLTAPSSGCVQFLFSPFDETYYFLTLYTEEGRVFDNRDLYNIDQYQNDSFVTGLTPGDTYFAGLACSAPAYEAVGGSLSMAEYVPNYLDETDVPDPDLRSLLEYYTGKEFTLSTGTPGADSISDMDLAGIEDEIRTDGWNGGPVITTLTNVKGIEYCDGTDFLLLNMNDLSGVDANLASIAGMDNLRQLDAYYCHLQDLEFLEGATNLENLAIVGNTDLDAAALAFITAANFPYLRRLDISGWDRNGDDIADYVTPAEWTTLLDELEEFTELVRVNLETFMDQDAMFAELYATLFSPDPSKWETISLSGNQISSASLASLVNLPNLELLNLDRNLSLTDLSFVAGMASLNGVSLVDSGITDITPLETLMNNGGLSDFSGWNHDIMINSCSSLDLTEGTANGDALAALVGAGVRVSHDASWIGHGPVWEAAFSNPEGAGIHGMAFDGTNLWMVARDLDEILKVDPSDGTVLGRFDSPVSGGTGLTWDGTNLWFTSDNNDPGYFTLYKLDPADGTVLTSFNAPGSHDSTGMTWDGTALWNTGFHENLYRIDPADGTVLATLDAPEGTMEGMAYAHDVLYVLSWEMGEVGKIDPATGELLDHFSTPEAHPLGLTYDGTHLWCSIDGGTQIYRMDISSW